MVAREGAGGRYIWAKMSEARQRGPGIQKRALHVEGTLSAKAQGSVCVD